MKFYHFLLLFYKTEKAIHGGGGVEFENGTFSTGPCHEPVLMPQTPLVPVGGSNRTKGLTFSTGWCHEPVLMGIAPFSPGSCLKPGLKGSGEPGLMP